ncbi:MAG: hydrogenase expression/formation protein HypE [Kiritimatiellae bacterium]|nr:hydrogenase expression/formation protein HypE [Kiritimatiellia bacterium]
MTDRIQLAHGGGGRMMRELIEREIVPRFGGGADGLPDAATLGEAGGPILFTTDAFVVQPLEFPGGTLGRLAVHGTVNDLAVCGAAPRWLSLALVLEEGLPLDTLRRLLDDARDAAAECAVRVVTGDTKVVPHGQCDGAYAVTAGIGVALGFDLGPDRIRPGDRVLASGTLGDHGMAVMAAREPLGFETGPQSDTAPLHRLVAALVPFGPAIRFMRDPTRGGTAAVLNEIAGQRRVEIVLREEDLPVAPATQAVAEMLGFDVLNSASEGRVILVCAAEAAEPVLDTWRRLPHGGGAAAIGTVASEGGGRVALEMETGGRRLVDVPHGELLPRIC